MSDDNYELPKHLPRYLASLSRLYAQEGERALQEVIVNAQPRVAERWTYDNWNGGTYGHALYLAIPESLFLPAAKNRDEMQTWICRDLNALHNLQNEHVAEVFLEMDLPEDGDWRQESGLLIKPSRSVAPGRSILLATSKVLTCWMLRSSGAVGGCPVRRVLV